MIRVVLVLMAVLAVVFLVRRLLAGARSAGTGPAPEVSELVRCARCGVHIARAEAILSRGQFYCCDAHRRAAES